ncbi:MAG: BamA/TamA family outer membrane protein [Crocinitomicaceae bacterium]|nr:BamA/TamA family outer membrane protein [Crocinitomicaceae bacterium]
MLLQRAREKINVDSRHIIRCFLFIFFSYCYSFSYPAQDSIPARRNTLLAYPVAFHLPETRWGLGFASSYHFFVSKKDSISPPSQIQAGIAFTQNRQVLFSLPFQLFWHERLHTLTGEAGYYDFSYNFYGVGNDETSQTTERFDVEFLQVRINYLRRLVPHFFAGARWWYENYKITGTKENGLLASGRIPGAVGSITSGPGIVFLYDSRDNIYYTKSGFYLELVYHNQSDMWGSNFSYDRYRFDARYFFSLRKKQALAFNVFGDFIAGSVPFSQMPNIGSSKRMRGYYEGRYRNKNMQMLQAEYRVMPFDRWGLAAFAGYALLARSPDHFEVKYAHFNAGIGARFVFDRAKKMNLRLDYAVGKNSSGLYFTVGEAF